MENFCGNFHISEVIPFLSDSHLKDNSIPFERSLMEGFENTQVLTEIGNLCPRCCSAVWSDGYGICISGLESRCSWSLEWMSLFC